MKKADAHEPYVQSFFPQYAGMSFFGCILIVWLGIIIQSIIAHSTDGIILGGIFLSVPISALFLLWRSMASRFTISAEGVELAHKRKGRRIMLPWSSFTHMYMLQGYKTVHVLLADRLMDQPAQYAAFKACKRNREFPRMAGGCLVLTGVYTEVTARIPAHITQVPEGKCCSFWDGYRGL